MLVAELFAVGSLGVPLQMAALALLPAAPMHSTSFVQQDFSYPTLPSLQSEHHHPTRHPTLLSVAQQLFGLGLAVEPP